jgi:hypothetical protein
MCGTERRGGGIVRADAVEEGWDSDGDGIRAPDATVRERLIGGHAPPVVRTSIPTGGGASGLEAADDEDDGFNNLALGALVGGIFGGVASMLGGSGSDGSRRSDSREGGFMWGALQGAAYGAAASSTFAGGSTRVSYSSGGSRNSSGSRSSFQRRTSAGAGGASANTFESMLRFLLSHGDTGTSAGAATPNVDQMSYDQLLARFGFGTDARAASESTISSLPTEVLAEDNVDDSGLPNQCAICLENLLCGEQVRRLPCKHIYHTACIDEWLRNVSSCPVCKSRV